MNAERVARLFVIGLAVGLPLAALAARWWPMHAIEIHGRIAESGGWTPGDLTVPVGEPLHLRLTSDDALHGFAVGQTDWPAIDVKPGEWTEATLTFEQPGKYTFYCTRWCGPNHWRMRGTIEVSAPQVLPSARAGEAEAEPAQPLYVTLGLDLDAPHPPDSVPDQRPSPERGAQLRTVIPARLLDPDYYRAHSPSEVFRALRPDPATDGLGDDAVWDVIAYIWAANSTAATRAEAQQLFAQNCAACHGETGQGDGVMARYLGNETGFDRDTAKPVDFTGPNLLGASPAVLQGKIIRGGMGTGMPYWGPIFTEAQTWALVSYVYTFQFEGGNQP